MSEEPSTSPDINSSPFNQPAETWAPSETELVGRIASNQTLQDALRVARAHEFSQGQLELVGSVVKAAAGSLVAVTNSPPTELRYGSGTRLIAANDNGLKAFGSNPMVEDNYMRSLGETLDILDTDGQRAAIVEAVQFQSWRPGKIEQQRFTRQEKGLFGRSKTIEWFQPVEQPGQPVGEIRNLATGEIEPMVIFRYAFSALPQSGWDSARLGEYLGGDGQPGNSLKVTVSLPKSVATKLEKEIIARPTLAREVAHQLLLSEGGMSEEAWQGRLELGDGNKSHPIRPPYENLPDDWTIALFGDRASLDGKEIYLRAYAEPDSFSKTT